MVSGSGWTRTDDGRRDRKAGAAIGRFESAVGSKFVHVNTCQQGVNVNTREQVVNANTCEQAIHVHPAQQRVHIDPAQ